MKYARILNNVVQEIFTLPENLNPENFFSENDLKMFFNYFEKCDENILVSWIKNQDGTFSEPVIETQTEIKNT